MQNSQIKTHHLIKQSVFPAYRRNNLSASCVWTDADISVRCQRTLPIRVTPVETPARIVPSTVRWTRVCNAAWSSARNAPASPAPHAGPLPRRAYGSPHCGADACGLMSGTPAFTCPVRAPHLTHHTLTDPPALSIPRKNADRPTCHRIVRDGHVPANRRKALSRWCAEWHDTLLVAFAGHFHRAVAEMITSGHVESDQFRHTHAGGIQQFQHCRVTQLDAPAVSYSVPATETPPCRPHQRGPSAAAACVSFSTAGSVSGIFGVMSTRSRIRVGGTPCSWSYAHAKNPRTATVLRRHAAVSRDFWTIWPSTGARSSMVTSFRSTATKLFPQRQQSIPRHRLRYAFRVFSLNPRLAFR